jgi:hypothetical protein
VSPDQRPRETYSSDQQPEVSPGPVATGVEKSVSHSHMLP